MADNPVFHKEMGLGHAEFFRILPRAAGEGGYAVDGSHVTIGDGERRIVISLSGETERRLGEIVLPVTRVRIEFVGYGGADARRALDAFEKHFQKGGG